MKAVHPEDVEAPVEASETHRRNGLILDREYHCCHFVGSNLLLCGRKTSRWPFHWFIGPHRCGMVCTYFVILLCYTLFLALVASQTGVGMGAVGVVNCLGLLMVFTSTACTDQRPTPIPIFEMFWRGKRGKIVLFVGGRHRSRHRVLERQGRRKRIP